MWCAVWHFVGSRALGFWCLNAFILDIVCIEGKANKNDNNGWYCYRKFWYNSIVVVCSTSTISPSKWVYTRRATGPNKTHRIPCISVACVLLPKKLKSKLTMCVNIFSISVRVIGFGCTVEKIGSRVYTGQQHWISCLLYSHYHCMFEVVGKAYVCMCRREKSPTMFGACVDRCITFGLFRIAQNRSDKVSNPLSIHCNNNNNKMRVFKDTANTQYFLRCTFCTTNEEQRKKY